MFMFVAITETKESEIKAAEIKIAGKSTENQTRLNLLFAVCPILSNLSRFVLFLREHRDWIRECYACINRNLNCEGGPFN